MGSRSGVAGRIPAHWRDDRRASASDGHSATAATRSRSIARRVDARVEARVLHRGTDDDLVACAGPGTRRRPRRRGEARAARSASICPLSGSTGSGRGRPAISADQAPAASTTRCAMNERPPRVRTRTCAASKVDTRRRVVPRNRYSGLASTARQRAPPSIARCRSHRRRGCNSCPVRRAETQAPSPRRTSASSRTALGAETGWRVSTPEAVPRRATDRDRTGAVARRTPGIGRGWSRRTRARRVQSTDRRGEEPCRGPRRRSVPAHTDDVSPRTGARQLERS